MKEFKQFLKDLDNTLGTMFVVALIVLLLAMVVAPREVFTILGVLK